MITHVRIEGCAADCHSRAERHAAVPSVLFSFHISQSPSTAMQWTKGEALRLPLAPCELLGTHEVDGSVHQVQRETASGIHVFLEYIVLIIKSSEWVRHSLRVRCTEKRAHQAHAVHAMERKNVDIDCPINQHSNDRGHQKYFEMDAGRLSAVHRSSHPQFKDRHQQSEDKQRQRAQCGHQQVKLVEKLPYLAYISLFHGGCAH